MDNWMSANKLKLNMDKTELLWAGTRYNMSMLNDSGHLYTVQLNNVTVNSSMYACSDRVHLSSDGHMFPVSARPALIIFVISDASGGRLTLIRRQRRSCLRDVACRLLQCNPRRGSEDNNRQATTSVKRCCTSRQRHQEV